MVERRLTWLALIIAAWGLGILGKLVSIQAIHHKESAGKARSIHQVVVQIPAPRGTIFDRNGQPLAMSLSLDSVTVNPQKIQDIPFAAELLSLMLHLDREELESRIQTAYENGRGYLRIKRGLTSEETDAMRKLAVDGIALEHESQRHYPKGGLAAHVIGGVDFQEKGN